MRRFGLLVLAAATLAGCEEIPTEPQSDQTISVTPQAMQGGSSAGATLLGTTNAFLPELVEVNLDAGTVTFIAYIADPSNSANPSPIMSGLSFDSEGTLYATQIWSYGTIDDGCDFFTPGQTQAPGGRCSHLYRVDPATGMAEFVGNTGVPFLSDIDFAADGRLFATYRFNETKLDGALATLDLGSGAATPIHPPPPDDRPGFRLGGDGLRKLSNGGLSVHPVTGEVWAVENNAAKKNQPSLFRVDPATGRAIDPVLEVGLGADPVGFGFGALEILPDGRFIVVSGGNVGDVYELDPNPDANGRAPLTLIALEYGPEINGFINGLEFMGSANQPPIADAGMPQSAECASPDGSAVALDGTGSSDPDGDEITYLWSADGVTFDDPTGPTPTGTFPLGTSVVTLTVTDAGGLSSESTVEVHIEDTAPPTVGVHVAIVNKYRGRFGIRGAAFRILEPVVEDVCDASPNAADALLTLNGHAVSPGDLVRLRLERRTRVKHARPPFDLRMRAPSFVLDYGPVSDQSGNSASGQAAITLELFADAELSQKEVLPGTGEPGHSFPVNDKAAWEFAKHLHKLHKKGYSNPAGMPSAAVNQLGFGVPDWKDSGRSGHGGNKGKDHDKGKDKDKDKDKDHG